MIEEAPYLPALLDSHDTSYAADVMCRGFLETSSLAWWLLDPDIDAQRRVAPSLFYRLHTARQTERAIEALDLDPDDDQSGHDESSADVQNEVDDLGWSSTCNKNGTSVSFGDTTESWSSYTEWAAKLVERIWPQRKFPYAVLSAVAHAELLGLQRNLAPSPVGTQGLRPMPGPDTVL